MNNKKGFVVEMLAFIVVGIIAVLFFAGMIYGFGLVKNTLQSGDLDNAQVNMTKISSQSFGYLADGMANLRLISAIILIGFFIATMVVAYFSTKHPIWIFVYLLITIIMVIFSVYVSNAYETMKNDPTIGSMVSGFTISDIIISYLPIWVSIIGLLGIVLSIIGSVVSRRLFEG